MRKSKKLQIFEVLQEAEAHLEVEETPTYDALGFTSIASGREAHTEALLALSGDIADACEDEPKTDPTASKATA